MELGDLLNSFAARMRLYGLNPGRVDAVYNPLIGGGGTEIYFSNLPNHGIFLSDREVLRLTKRDLVDIVTYKCEVDRKMGECHERCGEY